MGRAARLTGARYAIPVVAAQWGTVTAESPCRGRDESAAHGNREKEIPWQVDANW